MKKFIIILISIAVVLLGYITYGYSQKTYITGVTVLPEMNLSAIPYQKKVTKETRTFIHHGLKNSSVKLYYQDCKDPKFTVLGYDSITNEDDKVTTTTVIESYNKDGTLMIKKRVTYDGGYGRALKIMPQKICYRVERDIF